MGQSEKHKELSKTAIYWLYNRGCSVFANEVPTRNGIADALGVITREGQERVYYIEAKVSNSDLNCFKQRCCYKRSLGDFSEDVFHPLLPPVYKMGIDYYYIIIADGVKVSDSLYPVWGIINERGEVIRKAKRLKHEINNKEHIEAIAHVLVYKVFGKMYLNK